MKFTPRSMARFRAASETLSSVAPHSFPPMPHEPKPITEMFQPVRPNARYSIVIPFSVRYFNRSRDSPQPGPVFYLHTSIYGLIGVMRQGCSFDPKDKE